LRVQALNGVNTGLMFAIFNGKTDKMAELIWKMIKPAYEKPFNTVSE